MKFKRYMGIGEVSEYISIPAKTLYEWASMGRIPSIKIGRRVLFDIQDIDNVMEKLKRNEVSSEMRARKITGEVEDNDL